jgi:hypothetical protein
MANRIRGVLLAALLGWVALAAAAAEPLQVLYAEPFRAQSIQTPGAQKSGANLLRVQALGRTFDLALEDNGGLLRQAPPQTRSRLSNTQLLKGTIRNVPDSWVRLTLTDGVYSGAIWDGSELYGVEPRAVLDPVLVTPVQGAAGGSAIYRLSDTQGGALQGVCGLDTSATGTRSTPLARYRQLVGELQAAAAAATATREIEVSMVADFEFTSRQGAAAVATMANHVNVVDGIFSEQVGVTIVPTDFITFAADTDQFTTSDSGALLDQFADYRASTPVVRSRGLAHLLTGRQLNGDIIGIAFLGSLCVAREGVSLSESSAFIDTPLIMAHELGHNFGAPHDSEPGSACASTPPTFLMGPELNNSGLFSQCSLQQMQPVIAGASCVVPARVRDVGVTVPATTITAAPDQTFEFIADVTSTGTASAANVVVSVDLPGGLERLSLSSPGMDCAFTSTGVSCTEPELAAGETRRLSVQLRASAEGQSTVAAHVSSSNDNNATNNHVQTQITVAIPRDLTIAVAPQPITVVKGEPFQMTFDIASIASRTLNNVQVEITHYGGITATAATIDGGTCTVTGTQPMAVCTLPSLAPGVTRRLQATLVSESIGTINTPAAIRAFEVGNPTGQRFTEFFVATQAAHDLVVSTTSPIGQRVVIGTDAVWAIKIRSAGVRAVDNVTMQLSWIGSSTAFEFAVDPPVAQSCTMQNVLLMVCSFGSMQPGETRTLTLRAHDSGPADVRIDTRVWSTQQDDNSNDNAQSFGIQSMVADDVQMHIGFPSSDAFEGRDEIVSAIVTADGVNASENVVVTATLPAGFVVQVALIGQDTCPLLPATPNVVICSVAEIAPGDRRIMNLRYTAGAPGAYTGTFAVTASADATPANNSGTMTFNVAPNVDGALIGPPQQILRTDIPVELPFTLTTNKYTLPDARVDINWSQVEDVVVSAPGATCAGTSTGHTCLFGTLAPNSSIPFTVRLRASAPPWAFLNVRLSSPAETDPGNNGVFLTLRAFAPGDAAIVIPQPVPEATLGQRTEFAFDLNVAADVYEVSLELEFDQSRIANVFMGNCAFTATGMRCDLGSQQLQQSSRWTFSYVPNVVGTTPITVRVVSINDANPANDAQTATITIVAPPPPPPPPPAGAGGGGGGGGGPMSWPLLLALALFALREQLLRRHARIRPSQR